MDDFLILTPTRWKLRHAVRQVNYWFDVFGFEQHPDKTFIGRIEKEFDWLGYQFNEKRLIKFAPRTLKATLLKCKLTQFLRCA